MVEYTSKPSTKLGLNVMVTAGAVVAFVALVAWGLWAVYDVLGSLRSDTFLAPLRLAVQLYPITILVLIAVGMMFFFGLTRRSLWLLLPASIVILGVAWVVACATVVKIIREAM